MDKNIFKTGGREKAELKLRSPANNSSESIREVEEGFANLAAL